MYLLAVTHSIPSFLADAEATRKFESTNRTGSKPIAFAAWGHPPNPEKTSTVVISPLAGEGHM
jgi:hypothetical protein